MPCQVKSCYQSLLTMLRLFGIGLLLPAPKAEVIKGPTVLRCFIKYSWKINIWHANLAAILLETTDLRVITVRLKKSSLRAFSWGKSNSSFRTVGWGKKGTFVCWPLKLAVFTLETDDPSSPDVQDLSKLTEKQMNKVRRIVHPKLKPFYF